MLVIIEGENYDKKENKEKVIAMFEELNEKGGLPKEVMEKC